MITILTNMSLNDQNNVKIRLHGAHIIGAILMENCTTYNKDKPKNYVSCSFLTISKCEDARENTQTQHKVQILCLRLLRFLYSVEKNRKAFKLIFPHVFFGAFIDVGNYNKEFQVYIPLLKKFNKKLNVRNITNHSCRSRASSRSVRTSSRWATSSAWVPTGSLLIAI